MALPANGTSQTSKVRNGHFTRIASWNIRGGLQSPHDMDVLEMDMESFGIGICCLQETHCKDTSYTSDHNGHIVCLEGKNRNRHRRYGMGFYYSKYWQDSYYGSRYITDRICVAQFTLNKQSDRRALLTVINVYAPTAELALREPTELAAFYSALQETILNYKSRSAVLIVAGDFNAKLGQRQSTEELYMGSHSKGSRNRNGTSLAGFLLENELVAANTLFRHLTRNLTTWTGPAHANNKYRQTSDKPLYNQIDYIMVHRRQRHLVTAARAYSKTETSSDHRLLISTLNLTRLYMQQRPFTNPKPPRYDFTGFQSYMQQLAREVNGQRDIRPQQQRNLHEKLEQKIDGLPATETINAVDTLLTAAIHDVAKAALQPAQKIDRKNGEYLHDAVIKELTVQQLKLRDRILRSHSTQRIRKLKRTRNILTGRIKRRARKLRHERLDRLATTLEENRIACASSQETVKRGEGCGTGC
jgi:exonuclease III